MFQSKTIEQRLLKKVTKTDSCWLWNGAVSTAGYGRIGDKSKLLQAHRVAYVLWKKEIPSGLQIDHLCRNKLCVNPEHLEAVTHQVNSARANAVRWSGYTHCKRGHEFTDANTMLQHDKYRRCRTCHNLKSREYRKNK